MKTFRMFLFILIFFASVVEGASDIQPARQAIQKYFDAIERADYALLKKSMSSRLFALMDPEPVFKEKMKE